MKSKRIIVIFCLLVALIVAYAFHSILSGKISVIRSGRKHKITFDISSCFACYGCGCQYTIDDNDKYTLNEFDKTKCIYDLDDGNAGKYHSLISEKLSENTNPVDIYLEGEDYDKFMRCVKKYSR